MNKDQQLAEAIVNRVNNTISTYYFGPKFMPELTVSILRLIAEFKKEVAGEAWDVCNRRRTQERQFIQLGPHIEITEPDRETYLNNLNK